MAITYTEKAASGSTAGGTTATTAAFTATGGGILVAEFQCASDSSVVSADPTGLTGHGGSWTKLTGKSFQSANPSGNSSLWYSTDYTTGSATITATWATSQGVHAWYVFEIVGGSALTIAGSASFQGTARDIRGLVAGSGQFVFQHIAFQTGTITAVPACHMTEQEDTNVSGLVSQNAAIYNGGGPVTNPTVGGLSSAVVGQWFLMGMVVYEGSAPTVATRTNAVSVRSASAASPITIPNTGITSGGLDMIWRCVKPSTATASNMADGANTDFTASTDVTGGTGASAVDAGATRSRFDYRVFGASDTAATVSASFLNTPNSSVGIRVWNETLTGNPHELAMGNGDDATHGTARSATSAALALEPGDHVYAFCGSDTDLETTPFTAAALTATSITFGPTVEHMGAGGVAAGNDVGCMLYEAVVASGTATSAITLTLTGGPSQCGQTIFVVVHADAGGASGTGTPAAVVATTTVPAVTLEAGSTLAPAVIARSVTIPQATASAATDATATPAAIAATVALPAVTTAAGAVPTPAAIARSVTLPAATPLASSTVTPAAIARSVTLPTVTATGGAASSPAAIARTVTLGAVTTQAGSAPQPAAIARTISLPTATALASSTVTPAAIARSLTLPAVTTQAGSAGAPAAIARSVTVPAVTPLAGSVLTPAAIARSVTLPTVTASGGGSANATPAVIARSVTLPAPTPLAGSKPTPAAIARSISIPAATGQASKTALPSAIARSVLLPSVTATGGGAANASPAAITLALTLPAVTPRAGSVVTPARIACLVTIPAVSSQVSGTRSPSAVTLLIALPASTATASAAITADVIALAVVIGLARASGILPGPRIGTPTSNGHRVTTSQLSRALTSRGSRTLTSTGVRTLTSTQE